MDPRQKKYYVRFFSGLLLVCALLAGVYFVDSELEFSFLAHNKTAGETSLASRRGHVIFGSHRCHRQPPPVPSPNPSECYTDTFQEPANTSRAVDILFVVQTSSPSLPERQEVIAGLNDFIAALPDGGDYHIGVMLAHGSTSGLSGTLFKVDSEPLVLSTTTMTDAQIEAALSTKILNAPEDPDAGGGEEGLFSLFHGITTPSLLQASQAAGMFRPEAALGVVFIADRRDICAVVPAGVPAETDPGKIAARIRDCEGLTPQGLTNRIKTLKGDLPEIVSGILYTQNPTVDEGEIGYGYIDVINLNNGVAIDFASGNIPEGLASIAQLSGGQMVPQSSFTLTHEGADPATLKVQVNGQDVPYQLQGNVVTITQPIPAGAVITIYYCIKSTDQVKCTHYHGGKWHTHIGKQFWNHCHKRHGPDRDHDGDHDDDDDHHHGGDHDDHHHDHDHDHDHGGGKDHDHGRCDKHDEGKSGWPKGNKFPWGKGHH